MLAVWAQLCIDRLAVLLGSRLKYRVTLSHFAMWIARQVHATIKNQLAVQLKSCMLIVCNYYNYYDAQEQHIHSFYSLALL